MHTDSGGDAAPLDATLAELRTEPRPASIVTRLRAWVANPDGDPTLHAALSSVHDDPKRLALSLLMGGTFPHREASRG